MTVPDATYSSAPARNTRSAWAARYAARSADALRSRRARAALNRTASSQRFVSRAKAFIAAFEPGSNDQTDYSHAFDTITAVTPRALTILIYHLALEKDQGNGVLYGVRTAMKHYFVRSLGCSPSGTWKVHEDGSTTGNPVSDPRFEVTFKSLTMARAHDGGHLRKLVGVSK
ncbi:hypothetical protein P7C70_g6712, partial [Phenoliferia sp. Uapishka_3]